jgi:redox-sensitive bicupin YhaK (pirin superfamily)
MGFRQLWVINEDRVVPGELQRMSAGRGGTHSGLLFNAESAEARRAPRIDNDVDCPA